MISIWVVIVVFNETSEQVVHKMMHGIIERGIRVGSNRWWWWR